MPENPALQTTRRSSGINLAFRSAGDSSRSALVLLHGLPNSSNGFRGVIEPLSHTVFVVAPDLPGFGASDPLPKATFGGFADCIEELLAQLNVKDRFIYLHDFGAPVGFQLAMRAPQLVRGLIIQNANAHETGMGPQWAATRRFWAEPTPVNEKSATQHLTLEGTRDTYLSGLPKEIAARINPQNWLEDWRVTCLPGRMATQVSLLADYGRYALQFGEIAAWLKAHQPPALMVWGRHEPYFDIAEIPSWLTDLPRMEAHILDGGHLLLETHAARAAALMQSFLEETLAPPQA